MAAQIHLDTKKRPAGAAKNVNDHAAQRAKKAVTATPECALLCLWKEVQDVVGKISGWKGNDTIKRIHKPFRHLFICATCRINLHQIFDAVGFLPGGVEGVFWVEE